jgi:hypothetical protein
MKFLIILNLLIIFAFLWREFPRAKASDKALMLAGIVFIGFCAQSTLSRL